MERVAPDCRSRGSKAVKYGPRHRPSQRRSLDPLHALKCYSSYSSKLSPTQFTSSEPHLKQLVKGLLTLADDCIVATSFTYRLSWIRGYWATKYHRVPLQYCNYFADCRNVARHPANK